MFRLGARVNVERLDEKTTIELSRKSEETDRVNNKIKFCFL